MGTKNPRRIAATLALAAGMTMLGGMTAQADTTSVATSTVPNVEASATMTANAASFVGTVGPFPARWLCNFHRNNVGGGSGACYQGSGGWYYESV